MKKNYFIIFGKNGKIGKSLTKNLLKKKEKVISFSWKLTKIIINSENNFKDFLLNRYQINQENYNLIFINCLREKTDLSSSLELYKKFTKKFKEFNFEIKYIYLSTYEPHKVTGTKYREVKLLMEQNINKNYGQVIRIGYYLLNDEITSFNNNSYYPILTNIKKRPILVPITLSDELLKKLTNISKEGEGGKISSCYSNNFCVKIVPSYPFLILSELNLKKTKFFLPLPFKIISKLLFLLAFLLRYLKMKNNSISFLEKPYSLSLQQDILNKKVLK